MSSNKKYDVKDLYYATIEQGDNVEYGILKVNQDVIDIKDDMKYEIRAISNNKILLTNDKVITDLVPFTNVITYMCGEYLSKHILIADEKVSKTYDVTSGIYKFRDVTEIQQTLAIIKPDGIKNSIKIIDMIYKAGLKIEEYDVRLLDKDVLKEHYAHIIDKPFYPELESYMTSGEVVVMILKGKDAIEKLRNLMGPTNSLKAPKGTIRGEFGTDITHNAIHGSDSKENAKIEINRFFNQKQKRI